MNRDEIMEFVGASNWQDVAVEFSGKSEEEIKSKLNQMFPNDDNAELAAAISSQLS